MKASLEQYHCGKRIVSIFPGVRCWHIDGQWWDYDASILLDDGSEIEGCIEGDGHNFEESTLKDENGNPFKQAMTEEKLNQFIKTVRQLHTQDSNV